MLSFNCQDGRVVCAHCRSGLVPADPPDTDGRWSDVKRVQCSCCGEVYTIALESWKLPKDKAALLPKEITNDNELADGHR